MMAAAHERQEKSTPASQPTVLIVDHVEINREILERLLTTDGYRVIAATGGREAFDIAMAAKPDLVLSTINMPHGDGVELCRRLKQQSATRQTSVVLITRLTTAEDRARAVEAGSDDFLTQPVNDTELRARVRSLVRLKRYTEDLDAAEAVILNLAEMVELRDPSAQGHCQRIAAHAVALGEHLGLSDEDLAALYSGGFLHDIGKIAMPDAILLKPGPLTSEEFSQMKQHTVIGDHLCGNMRSLRNVRPIVRHHHERLDGSGYPDSLRGDTIPLLAQIVGIADVYDALTTERPYKAALPQDAAFAVLRADVARGWRRSTLVEAFIRIVRNGHAH